MTTIVEKEIYGSSLCFWGTTRPSGTTIPDLDTIFGESYGLNVCSVVVYANREPNPNGGFPPSPKIVNRISFEPTFDLSYLDPSAAPVGEVYFQDVTTQPFIASKTKNDLTRDYYGFSATNDVEWRVNKWGPAASISIVNDVQYEDKFVLMPWEDLKVKLYSMTLNDTLPDNTPGKTARFQTWNTLVTSPTNASSLFKIRIEFEEWNPSSQYYHRVSLNDLTLTGTAIDGDQDVILVDLREDSSTLLAPPFDKLFFNNKFLLENLDFRGAYPWGGVGTSKFMYSIMLLTEGHPEKTRYIRKYVRFQGSTATDLEINGLLLNVGPLEMQRGEYLIAKVYAFESVISATEEAHSSRQMPAFWLNGTVT